MEKQFPDSNLPNNVQLQDCEASLTAKIEHPELCQWRGKATAESKGRPLAEEGADRLYEASQELQDQIQDY